jgi:hypothetical protein
LVEHGDREAGQGVQRFLQYSGRFNPLIGNDERARYTHPFALLRKQANRPELELNLCDVVNE